MAQHNTARPLPALFSRLAAVLFLLALLGFLAPGAEAAPPGPSPMQPAPAGTTLTITGSDTEPSLVGNSYYVRFEVRPNPVTGESPFGTITVNDGEGSECSRTVTTGAYAGGWAWGCSLTTTSTGIKTLSAHFTPLDPTKFQSSADTASHTVNGAGVTVTGIDTEPSVVGQGYYVRFEVRPNPVTGESPFGTVTVEDGDGAECSRTVTTGAYAGGWAWGCTLNSAIAGNKTITATFVPVNTAVFGAYSVGQGAHTVDPADTTTAVTSSLNPSTYGDLVTFTVTVSPAPTGGTVQVLDNSVAIAGCGALALNGSGQATCTTSTLVLGAHSILAIYSGDANYNGSDGYLDPQQQVNCLAAITVTSDQDDGPGTLRRALAQACTDGTITFDREMTIDLESELVVDRSVTINGGGVHPVTISGGGAVRLFYVTSGAYPTFNHLTLADGYTTESGGAIYTTGSVTVLNSTLMNNTAEGDGGAIRAASLTLMNTSVMWNSADGSGGGVYGDHHLELKNSTFYGNYTGHYGGGVMNDHGDLDMYNTIIAHSMGSEDCSTPGGAITDNINNLVEDGSCDNGGVNFLTGDPLLGLADQIKVPMMAPLPGSPAIDAGDCNYGTTTDQRGVGRPVRGICDIGAWESGGFLIELTGGNDQVTPICLAFPQALTFSVAPQVRGEPVNGGQITFTVPASGASAAVVSNPVTISGGAASASATANCTPGSYQVLATSRGFYRQGGNAIHVSLTNAIFPNVVSILRLDPSPTNAVSVRFAVLFSEAVTGVDLADFQVDANGLIGAVVTGVSGSGNLYTVTVGTGTGGGTLGLDLLDDDTILNLSGYPLGWTGLGNGSYDLGDEYIIDKTPPETVPDSTPPDPSRSSSATFSFHSPDATAGFQCSLDGADYGTCITPVTYTSLAEGDHTFLVRAVDPAGNADPTPFEHAWTVDLTPPQTTITSAPANPTNVLTVHFEFGSSEAGTFQCSLDGAAFSDCSSPQDFPGLGEGGHTFAVQAIDLAGNMDNTPATHAWSIDRTASELLSFTRQDPAGSPTNADTLIFRAVFNEDVRNVDPADFALQGTTTATVMAVIVQAAHTYDIVLSGGDLATFNGTVGVDLAAGQNITDLAGNALPAGEPGTDETYLVDNTPPALSSFTRQDPATNPTNADILVMRVTFSEAVQNVGAVDFNLDSLTTATITNVAVVDARTYDMTISGGDLSTHNGTVGLNLAAVQDIRDLAGNALPMGEPAIDHAYMVDNIAPVFDSITQLDPAASPTNADILIFRAAFNEPMQNVGAGDFAVNGTTTATVTGVTAFDAFTYDITISGGDLASFNGTVGVDLAAGQDIADQAGNALPAGEPATDETYVVDNTPPDTLLDSAPADPTNDATPTFIFHASEAGSTFECSLDGAAYAPCTSGIIFEAQGEGSHTFRVQATDLAGNLDLTPASYTWTIDLTPPETNLDSHPENPVRVTRADFTFSSPDVTAAFECALDGAAFAACTSPLGYDDLAEGAHTFQVRALDPAGNIDPTPASFTWIIDLTPPVVTAITDPSLNPTNAGQVWYRVSFSEAVVGVGVNDFSIHAEGITGARVVEVTGEGRHYTVVVSTGHGGGTLRLDMPETATVTDLAGNPLVELPYTEGAVYEVRFTTFADVPVSHWAWRFVERLYDAGLTTGCGSDPLVYCPEENVTRAQMAAFLERGLHYPAAFVPPAGTGLVFGDVPPGYWAAGWIEALFADGLTTGCAASPLVYCPEEAVSRAQMAVFLLRARHGAGYVPPAATGIFSDVPLVHWAAAWIEQLFAEGITTGCSTGPLSYCPEEPVTRAQMAVFLVRTFLLP